MVKYICDKCKKEGFRDERGFPSIILHEALVNASLGQTLDLCDECFGDFESMKNNIGAKHQLEYDGAIKEWLSK